jgi:hypothetical protein
VSWTGYMDLNPVSGDSYGSFVVRVHQLETLGPYILRNVHEHINIKGCFSGLFDFHLLPLDKWDWCKTGTLNVQPWAINVIVNRWYFE